MRKSKWIVAITGLATLTAASAMGYVGTRLAVVTGNPTEQNNCDNPHTGRTELTTVIRIPVFPYPTKITKTLLGPCSADTPPVTTSIDANGIPVTGYTKCVPIVEPCPNYGLFGNSSRIGRPGDIRLRVRFHGVPTEQDVADLRISFRHANRILCDATDGYLRIGGVMVLPGAEGDTVPLLSNAADVHWIVGSGRSSNWGGRIAGLSHLRWSKIDHLRERLERPPAA